MKKFLVISLAVVLGLLFTGCGVGLFPQFTYQGVLTDASGTPLSGSVKLTYRIYNASTGGSPLYTETETATLNDGRFDSVVGPNTAVGSLSPEDLAQPLWIEVEVGNGTYTETLTPRQRLYGAPYAFTLMPGTVITQTFDAALYPPAGINAVVTIGNGEASDPIPALRVVGQQGIELVDLDNDDGTLYSELSASSSDLFFRSNDDVYVYIDDDNGGETGYFYVYGNPGYCRINETGQLFCTGTKSSVVQVEEQSRALYAIESPDVWFEDFGAGQLVNGKGFVQIDPLFAEAVNLNVEYHVFLTPLGECNGLYVAKKSSTGFEVRELGGGSASVAFDYRIVAKRAGYEDVHMEVVPSGIEEGE